MHIRLVKGLRSQVYRRSITGFQKGTVKDIPSIEEPVYNTRDKPSVFRKLLKSFHLKKTCKRSSYKEDI